MTPPALILRQDWVGELLFAAQSFAVAGQPPHRLCIQLGNRWLTLAADADEPQLHVTLGQDTASLDEAGANLLQVDPFGRFSNSPLYSWWLLENENGVQDGLLLLFDRTEGVLIVAQPGWLDLMAVSHPFPHSSTR